MASDHPRRKRLDPATARIRFLVRAALQRYDVHIPLVAVSGGADSMSLAAAVLFVQRAAGRDAWYAVIDHGLQMGSAAHTAQVVQRLEHLGARHVVSRRVHVGRAGGVEAAARVARYTALHDIQTETGCDALLVAHTRDDQAETVLLNLSRGAGPAGLSGLLPWRAGVLRPLLAVGRAETQASCRAQGIPVWQDPMNEDPAFARVRVRTRVLPVLEQELGPGYAAALARAARQVAADDALLNAQAADRVTELVRWETGTAILPVPEVSSLPEAIRHRLLRQVLATLGCAPLSAHIDALDRLLGPGRGGRRANLPGVLAVRAGTQLRLARIGCS